MAGSKIHAQQQSPPGRVAEMDPQPDHGEKSYEGTAGSTARPR